MTSCLHDYPNTETLAPERSYRITSKSVRLVSETSPALEPVIFTDEPSKVVESVGHRRTWAYKVSLLLVEQLFIESLEVRRIEVVHKETQEAKMLRVRRTKKP